MREHVKPKRPSVRVSHSFGPVFRRVTAGGVVMANGQVTALLKQEQAHVKVLAGLGEKWRDWDKPLGARKAPPPMVPGGLAVKIAARAAGYGTDLQNVMKGRALKSAATEAGLAGEVQREIEGIAPKIGALHEPQRSINLAYLNYVADGTVAAARACQKMRRGKSAPKKETQMAVAWVVTIGCGLVPKLDQRVKNAAIRAYPLCAAGRKLDESVGPEQAIHAAYEALGVA